MKAKKLVLLIIVIFIFSCSEKKEQNDSTKNTKDVFVAENCLTEGVNHFVANYIEDTKFNFMTSTRLYYNLYFSKIKNTTYFTIWVYTSMPCEYLDNNSYLFNYQKIDDYDVFLIKNKSTKIPVELNCKFLEASEIKVNIGDEKNHINYDGSWFLQTYRYLPENDLVIRQDSLITDFLEKDAPIYMIKDNRKGTNNNTFKKKLR